MRRFREVLTAMIRSASEEKGAQNQRLAAGLEGPQMESGDVDDGGMRAAGGRFGDNENQYAEINQASNIASFRYDEKH
jgi:hypothetical protein